MTTPLRFGIQLTAVHGAGTVPRLQLEEHEELVRLAASSRFDVMAVGQHYLTPELRYYQPVPYLAHLSGVAPNMRVATGIILLPLHNPVDIAEQIATLDVISDGRAVLGVGIGYADHEFTAFGVDRRTRVSRFTESLEVIRALWSGQPTKHVGRHFVIDPLATGTLPIQEPGPPIWGAAQSEAAVRRVAATCDTWYVPPFVTHEELVELYGSYKAELEQAGKPPPTELPVRRELFIADSHDEALAGAAERMSSRFDTYLRWGLGRDLAGGGFGPAEEANILSRFIVGTPETCAEQILNLRAKVPMSHLILKPQWPGLAHREAVSQLERFCTEVVPRLGTP
jgi:alkanesulfonate monooxygenase SsuD/methylene tetrahydromethanopterin reductase-like flavin-dependent oxidoreductase (luciferase family)